MAVVGRGFHRTLKVAPKEHDTSECWEQPCATCLGWARGRFKQPALLSALQGMDKHIPSPPAPHHSSQGNTSAQEEKHHLPTSAKYKETNQLWALSSNEGLHQSVSTVIKHGKTDGELGVRVYSTY